MVVANTLRSRLAQDAGARFVTYAKVLSRADSQADCRPSTPGQMEMLELVARQAREMNLANVEIKEATLYFELPATPGVEAEPFGLIVHVDTSYEVMGDASEPRVIERYDGNDITFPNSSLVLRVSECPELQKHQGHTLYTGRGDGPLGADDKAGIATVMSALKAFIDHPELRHPRIVVCVTTDEEIGKGMDSVDFERLPRCGYTVDGGALGVIERENFWATRIEIGITGCVHHPGYAYEKMINAAIVAAEFVAALPRDERPENRTGREGFYYVIGVEGSCGSAKVQLAIRDFEKDVNEARLAVIYNLVDTLRGYYPGVQIKVKPTDQYPNMRDVVAEHMRVFDLALAAIRDAQIEPIEKPIRGGTDGAALAKNGLAYPNLFCGQINIHSLSEFVAAEDMGAAALTIIHLGNRWAERGLMV